MMHSSKDNFIEGLEIIEEDSHSFSHHHADNNNSKNRSIKANTTTPMSKEEAVARRVFVSRLVVVLVILFSTAAVSTSAYKLLKRDELGDFESKSVLLSKEIAHLSTTNAMNIFQSIGNLAQLFPAMAKEKGETLPFATFYNFEALALGTRRLAKAESILYLPLLKTEDDLVKWGEYSVNRTSWMDRGRTFGVVNETKYSSSNDTIVSSNISSFVFGFRGPPPLKRYPVSAGNGYISPIWHIHPVPTDGDIINYDLGQDPVVMKLLNFTTTTFQPVLSGQNAFGGNRDDREDQSPDSMLMYPIFNGFPQDKTYELVGHIVALIPWTTFLSDVLQEEQEATVVIESCDKNTTFLLSGSNSSWIGSGDLHDTRFEYLVHKRELITFFEYENADKFEEVCRHQLYIFPTSDLFGRIKTRKPVLYSMVIVAIFVLMAFVIYVYDFLVTTRQEKTEKKAEKSNAIVQELFPGNTAEQLFNPEREEVTASNSYNNNKNDSASASMTTMTRQSTIAELYPNATIMFADIAGFTSWSSLREPTQVFLLLESIFQSFDTVAKRLGVFKVETIGDCYVAVCGVPKPNTKHAVVMAEFAREALMKFDNVVRGDLEMTLGPDTAELGLRVGLHTGPVTAGVIRGERARFQLFGDSVNTTARIESTGRPDQIHISEQTAKELKRQGKGHWCIPREEKVVAKGKGELDTYWLLLDSGRVCDNLPIADESVECTPQASKDELRRSHSNGSSNLVDWNTEVLVQLLSNVVACRPALQFDKHNAKMTVPSLTELGRSIGASKDIVGEIADVIVMPKWMGSTKETPERLGKESVGEIRAFVERIASLYNNVPFHNFEHASHVAMSTNKILSSSSNNYGVETDPLTQFACFFAALVHDVGHVGVQNGALAKENPSLAASYNNKSIAEQHSVTIAWNTLFLDEFVLLRSLMFTSEAELRHFRQLLVNALMSTDIFDESLRTGRQSRWSQVFGGLFNSDADRRSTIVLEHLIQASDVSHTMQHWHVYRKWNERLFSEMYEAFRAGRIQMDPRSTWYEGELSFFDNYVIPLAHKMRDCNFGAASDEYLNYAMANRSEWCVKGRDLVTEMVAKLDGLIEL